MKLEHINCLICGKGDHPVIIKENGYDGKKCGECNLIYISPRPHSESIFDLYGHDNANLSAESHINSSYQNRLYAKHNIKLIKPFIKNGILLEIGPGSGEFLDEAQKNGYTSNGLELNSLQASHIRNHYKIHCEESSLVDSSFKDNMFDIIYHCDVISHFFDPIEELLEINKKLKKDGLLVFETGNLGETNPKYFKSFERFMYPDHLFFFGEKSIIKILELTGFKVKKIHRYSILPQIKFLNLIRSFLMTVSKFFRNKMSSVEDENPNGSNIITREKKSKSFVLSIKNILQKVYFTIIYFLRYYVGAINIKMDSPKTIIIIASKIK